MVNQSPDGFFMIGECFHAFAHGEVPAPDCVIVAAADYLRLEFLGDDAADNVLVSRQAMHLVARPDVPHSYASVPSPREHQVQSRVLSDAIHLIFFRICLNNLTPIIKFLLVLSY